jgi:hypothetical protein
VNRFFLVPVLALAGGAALGCNSKDNGTIQIITDEEAGTFSESPAPTELQIVAVESADASTILATAQLPTSTIDLGNLAETTTAVSINISGYDATNTRRVFGASLPVQYAALAGQSVPVFVQRDGELARLPGPLPDSRPAPVLAVLQSQYLLIAGGDDPTVAATTQLFDFGEFAALASPPTLPLVPQSLALVGTLAWIVNASGGAYFNFQDSTQAALSPPPDGTFADVAGGATVVDDTGAQYIVGGTRTAGTATNKALKIDPNDLTNSAYPFGNATWITLTTPRLGAAATWVTNRGLVVVGGNVDPAGAGIEIVAPGAAVGSALGYPSDPTVGAGAASIDGQHVLLAGGISGALQDPGVRLLDLNCTPSPAAGDAAASNTCAKTWATLPVTLDMAQAFQWTATDGLVIGNELLSGKTHVFRLTATSATEVPTRAPHVNASAVWSPVGSIVLFGGANVIESFSP